MQFKNSKLWLSLKKTPLIRTIRPTYIALQNIIDPLFIYAYKNNTGWAKPIPPVNLRRITSGPSIPSYVESGERIAKSLREGLKTANKKITDVENVLDFGCGAGRIAQYFSEYDEISFTGCDPNPNLIEWLSHNYHSRTFYNTKFHPPLPFESNTFDLIYSVSVFTHLSEKLQFSWLQELQRVLRQDGIALITVLGKHGANRDDRLGLSNNLTKRLAEKNFIFKRTSGTKLQTELVNPNAADEDEIYGLTYHSKQYIYQNWQDFGDIVDIKDGVIDDLQDLVVLKNSK
ncbi:conserved hypothetical protein [Hyella patelloides LEGE 07179]|uniref:Methyltransferase type 11 domain-containing protein n=1 Tax=Hyella patelloides LEGE 07179 TaxID=945734 RepID=A0A563VMP2_9CYAN|nr:class I SAM-dependent methyltransferase [Hyella patelloides]VEP12682.1 conserved hypothetical protein [Hyella patelloides LEGE 07179]